MDLHRGDRYELLLVGNGLLITRPVVVAAQDLAKKAATAEEVAKALDLRTLPLPAGATVDGERSLGMLNYMVGGDPAEFAAKEQRDDLHQGRQETDAGLCRYGLTDVNLMLIGIGVTLEPPKRPER